MKLPGLAAIGLAVLLPLAGCGSKIQSDLELQNAKFSVSEGGKAQFTGTVRNTGKQTYKSVFIVVNAYEGNDYALQISTSADLFAGNQLTPDATTSFSKDFEDAGFKPNRYELIRLYGLQ